MKYLIYILLIIFLCGLNAGLAPFMAIHGQMPNFLFLLVIVWSLDKTDDDFLFLAFFAGLFLDFYSGSWPGSFTVPLLVISLVLHVLAKNFLALELNVKYLSIVLLPAALLFDLGFLLCSVILSRLGLPVSVPVMNGFVQNFSISFFYNLVFLYPVFALAEYAKTVIAKHVSREYKVR